MALPIASSSSSPSLRRTRSTEAVSSQQLLTALARTHSIPSRLPETSTTPIVFGQATVSPTERPFSPRPPSSAGTLGSGWTNAALNNPRPEGAPYPRRPSSRYHRTMGYLGYGPLGSKARRLFVHTVWIFCCSVAQICSIIVLLTLSAVFKSPTEPTQKQWEACARPLRVWCIIWIFMSLLLVGLQYWNFIRERKPRLRRDTEQGTATIADAPSSNGHTQPTDSPHTPETSANVSARPPLPHMVMFARLNLFQNLLSITWFVTAHILVYGSIHTCRLSSPILWWLTFSLLCIMYVTVVEIILLGLAVLIVLPLVFLFWNIVLFLTGNHPLQNPIRPEIGKLPKSVVDRIPLVLYIPAPEKEEGPDGITAPPAAYSYPPQPTKVAPPQRKKRFRFLKKVKFSKKQPSGSDTKAINAETNDEKKDAVWEDLWETGDFPFVRLDENRSTCAICLGDFEAPRRIGEGVPNVVDAATTTVADASGSSIDAADIQQIVPVEHPTESEVQEQLKLEDVGEGPQPLRLLECGHAFHQTCLDPWLINTSGRCPLCQKPVELPVSTKKSKQRS